MKEISLDELKKIELRTMKQFHELCQQEGLRYTVTAGTLLGAIRHKGFIPWDDDIDVAMPRPDYEKLIAYCQTNETPFRLICSKTEPGYGYVFGKAVAADTVIVEENSNPKKIDMGVYIDIFPLDGLGDTAEESRKHLEAKRFSQELLIAANWTRFFRSRTRAWYYEPIRFAFFLLSRFVSFPKLIASIERHLACHSFDDAKYVVTTGSTYRDREIFPAEIYSRYIDVPFEDIQIKAIAEYDCYLKQIYGDYMQLPPEEKRVTHHMFRAYYKEDKERT